MDEPGKNVTHQRSAFYARWAELVIDHRTLFLCVVLAVTAGLAAYGAEHLRVDNNIDSFAPPNSPEIKTLKSYRDTFGRADAFLILVKGDVFSPAFLERLKGLHDAIGQINVQVKTPSRHLKKETTGHDTEFEFSDTGEGWGDEEQGTVMARVTSLINVRQTVAVADGIDVRKLLDPMPKPAQLPALKARVLQDTFLVGQVVDPKGQYALLTAYTIDMEDNDIPKVTREVLKIAQLQRTEGFEILVTGPPAIASMIDSLVMQDLSRLGLYSLLLVIMVLAFLFRHWVGIMGPVSVILVSVVCTLGLMAMVGFSITILSGILPAFLFCVGVCDSIHMLSIYRDLKAQGVGNRQAIIDAVSITGAPVFYTSLTTMCGLFSLNFASVTVISEMGLAGGMGVIVAWLMSLIILPIVLTLNTETPTFSGPVDQFFWRWVYPVSRVLDGILRSHKNLGLNAQSHPGRIDTFLDGCVDLSRGKNGKQRHATVLWVSVGVGLLALWGVTQLRVFHDDLDLLPDDAMVKVAVYELDKHIGGAAIAELVITARKGNLKDVEFLKGLDALVTEVLDYREPQTGEKIVTHALSLLDVVKETRRAFKGGDRAAYALPTSQQEANDFLFAFENQSPSELSKLTTIDWSKTHVTFRVRWREATAYGPLIEHIKKSAQTHLGDRVDIAGTGPVYVVTRLVKVMLDDLAKSFGTAFLLVSIFMVFMLRDLKLGLVAMMPNLFPILLVMGFMGLSAMPLDLNTLLIASIALGIAVDDTVHFLHHFQASFVATKDCELGIQAAKRHAGRAMLTTSLVLTVGFIILCLASNDALIRFGLLTALTIVSALFTDLIVLPAFLRWLYPRRTSTDFAAHQSDLSQSH